MIEIHLYGKLRHYANGSRRPGNGSVIVLEPRSGETIASLLAHVEIPVDEINHVFFNSKLLASRAKMASFMGFRQSHSDLSDWNLDVPIDNGDRIGLFGRDMALLGM
jgi:hypothetical protein